MSKEDKEKDIVYNNDRKKLRTINITKEDEEDAKKLVTRALQGAAFAAANGALAPLLGGGIEQAMSFGGVMLGGMTLNSALRVCKVRKNEGKPMHYVLATGLVGAVLGAPAGAGIGAGMHKLTTSIINHLQPKHQIEQTVEVESIPVIDEIQVEK